MNKNTTIVLIIIESLALTLLSKFSRPEVFVFVACSIVSILNAKDYFNKAKYYSSYMLMIGAEVGDHNKRLWLYFADNFVFLGVFPIVTYLAYLKFSI